MRVSFINPPRGRADHLDLAPPLGLLTLAAAVERLGGEATLVDLNLGMHRGELPEDSGFYQQATQLIADSAPDLAVFTSMCVDSHVALILAERIKAHAPSVVTVFGGPHFGAAAQQFAARFPCIDYVVAGEGENSLVAIIAHLKRRALDLPSNVLACAEGKWGVAAPKPVVLAEAPFPAYHLVESLDDYFELNPRRLADYEAGRGCIFSCGFCYSPLHYSSARDRAPEQVVRDWRRLSELGFGHAFLVQDNFVNDPQWALSVCREMRIAESPLSWSCYATHPQLTPELLQNMARAGCSGVFVGVDAVPEASQVRLGKRFLRNRERLESTLLASLDHGITPTVALMIDSHHSADDLDLVVELAAWAVEVGCDIHLNTVSIYNGTKLSVRNTMGDLAYSSLKSELLFDAPRVVCDNRLARDVPELFPLHAVEGGSKGESLILFAYLGFTLLYVFPGLSSVLSRNGRSLSRLIQDLAGASGADEFLLKPPAGRRKLAVELLSGVLESIAVAEGAGQIFEREKARWRLSFEGSRSVTVLMDDRHFTLVPWETIISESEVAFLSSDGDAILIKELGEELATGLSRLKRESTEARLTLTPEEAEVLVKHGLLRASNTCEVFP